MEASFAAAGVAANRVGARGMRTTHVHVVKAFIHIMAQSGRSRLIAGCVVGGCHVIARAAGTAEAARIVLTYVFTASVVVLTLINLKAGPSISSQPVPSHTLTGVISRLVHTSLAAPTGAFNTLIDVFTIVVLLPVSSGAVAPKCFINFGANSNILGSAPL